jgi:glycosyltransferase involved in cell wall biosynthesis
VIVPVRNGARHLPLALRSLIEQDPAPAEILVVDGGSTDDSRALARGLPGVRLLAQNGLGLGAARNQALQTAQHDLLAFCDSDDQWAPDALRVRLELLRRRDECGAVMGRCIATALPDADTPHRRRSGLGKPMPGYTPGALLMRRAAFDRVGEFDESLAIGTDSDWFVRLVQSGVVWTLLEEVVLVKGLRTGSLSDDVAAYRAELLTVARGFVRRRTAGASTHPNDPA